jgi:hypothetical protein
MIFDIYNRLMDDFLEQKSLIPAGNLMEIRFEEFEQNPVNEMEHIYSNLLNEDFAAVKQYFSKYFNTQKSHKKNKYLVEAGTIEEIRKHLGKYIEMYGYELPEDIQIKI